MSIARIAAALTRKAGKLQEELCARIPEAEKRTLRVALGLEQDEVISRLQNEECCDQNFCRRMRTKILLRRKAGTFLRNNGMS
jgi:hypothetical protein